MDWIHLVQTTNKGWAVVYKVMNSNFPKEAGNLLSALRNISVWRITLLH